MNILLSLTKLNVAPKPVTITLVNFAVSGLTLIRQLPVPLLPLSSTPNLITVIFSTIGGAVAQRVECWTCGQQVLGSNPTPGKSCVTTLSKLFTPMCLCHQAV